MPNIKSNFGRSVGHIVMRTVRVSVFIVVLYIWLSPAVLPQPLDTGSPTLPDRKLSPTAPCTTTLL